MNLDTIYKSSMRKLSKAKSVGEIRRIESEFNRECDKFEKNLNDCYAKQEARMKEEMDRQEREFEARMEARRAEAETLNKEIEALLGRADVLIKSAKAAHGAAA